MENTFTVRRCCLDMTARQTVQAPDPATPLTVSLGLHNTPSLWIIVNPELPSRPRAVYLVSDGERVPMGARHYVSTFSVDQTIYHVFVGGRRD